MWGIRGEPLVWVCGVGMDCVIRLVCAVSARAPARTEWADGRGVSRLDVMR